VRLAEPNEQRLVVTDHDTRRPAGFVVIRIEDHEGQDLSNWFELTISPLESSPRSHVLTLSYRGGLERRFVRGRVRLAKTADAAPELDIGFSAFDRD
jgi:hypothetical protein